jgi:hypothetical protein
MVHAQAWKGDPEALARVMTVDTTTLRTLPMCMPSLNHNTRRAQLLTALEDPQVQYFALACIRLDPRLQFKKSTIYVALKRVAAAHATCVPHSYVSKWLQLEVPRVHLALKGIRAALRESTLSKDFASRLPENFKDSLVDEDDEALCTSVLKAAKHITSNLEHPSSLWVIISTYLHCNANNNPQHHICCHVVVVGTSTSTAASISPEPAHAPPPLLPPKH